MFQLIAIPSATAAIFVWVYVVFLRLPKLKKLAFYRLRLGTSLGFRAKAEGGIAAQPSVAASPLATAELVDADFIWLEATWNSNAICMNSGERRAICWCPKCKKDRKKYQYS